MYVYVYVSSAVCVYVVVCMCVHVYLCVCKYFFYLTTLNVFLLTFIMALCTIITNNSSDRIDPLLTTPEASGVPLDVSAPLCVLLKTTGDGCNYQSVVAGNEKNKLK